MGIKNNPKRLARLLLSVNTHKLDRPLTPVEVGKEIELWMKEDNLSQEKISKKLSFENIDMIKIFLSLLELPEQIQNIIEWGESKSQFLGFSVAAEISKLKNKKDMEILGKASMEHSFTKKEVISIAQLKERNKDKDIVECIEEIKKFKPKITSGYLVIGTISDKIKQLLQKISNEQQKQPRYLVKEVLVKEIPEQCVSGINLRENKVILTLDEIGYNQFNELPQKHNVLLKDIIEHLLSQNLN